MLPYKDDLSEDNGFWETRMHTDRAGTFFQGGHYTVVADQSNMVVGLGPVIQRPFVAQVDVQISDEDAHGYYGICFGLQKEKQAKEYAAEDGLGFYVSPQGTVLFYGKENDKKFEETRSYRSIWVNPGTEINQLRVEVRTDLSDDNQIDIICLVNNYIAAAHTLRKDVLHVWEGAIGLCAMSTRSSPLFRAQFKNLILDVPTGMLGIDRRPYYEPNDHNFDIGDVWKQIARLYIRWLALIQVQIEHGEISPEIGERLSMLLIAAVVDVSNIYRPSEEEIRKTAREWEWVWRTRDTSYDWIGDIHDSATQLAEYFDHWHTNVVDEWNEDADKKLLERRQKTRDKIREQGDQILTLLDDLIDQ